MRPFVVVYWRLGVLAHRWECFVLSHLDAPGMPEALETIGRRMPSECAMMILPVNPWTCCDL